MKDKTVLLFSGGLDSLCTAYLMRPQVLLYVPMGMRYEEPELERIRKFLQPQMLMSGLAPVTVVRDTLNLKEWERPDKIVPNRNALLVLVASMYGDNISLAAVAGDRSCDKDDTFCWAMTQLLRHTWQAQHWTPARNITVDLPVKLYTKSKLLERALFSGMPAQLALDSWSCYEAGIQPCGVCKPCVRKYVALTICKVHIPNGYYQHSPLTAPWINDALRAIRSDSGWRKEEDADFLQVMT
jgi:7-cyano-7-deazaguanine synthase in queuosine biosynthesis